MKTERAKAEADNKKRRKKKLIIFVAVLLVIAGLAVWAFYSGLTVVTYTVASEKVPAGRSVRIAVIADLHSDIFGNNQRDLLDMIKAQKPDIIALVGDIVDDETPEVGAKLFLEDVAKIAPAYYVSGNHEFWSGKCDEIKQMVRGYGITVLGNEREYITVNGVRLCICGVDDPEVLKYTHDNDILTLPGYESLLKRFSDLDDRKFNILLAHRPESIEEYRKYNFDLVLSGHTHGGQVRIPLFVNGIFAPDQGYFPKYGGGMYTFDDITMVISRGLTLKHPRVFNAPEVVIVDIEGENK